MDDPGTQAARDAYDGGLSALRTNAGNLAVAVAIWEARQEGKPDAHARRAGSDAIDAVDAMLRELYTIRQQLISEVQQADRATAARADALLARTDDAIKSFQGPSGLRNTEGRGAEDTPARERNTDE
jgi:hypothetical protein